MEDEQSVPISLITILQNNPVPDPLPHGWIIHKSRSYPGYAYYFHQFTGEKRWDLPITSNLEGLKETIQSLTNQQQQQQQQAEQADQQQLENESSLLGSSNVSTATDALQDNRKTQVDAMTDSLSKKRDRAEVDSKVSSSATATSSPDKKMKRTNDAPDKVRVLHILKKHKDSRRPASWRQEKITISKQEAIAELKEIISILEESKGDTKELRATFEELAKTESDCTSAKRGGDVGYFGRKKMQPNFEKASFSLGIGEMSGIVETSSGVHVILRLG